MTAMLGKEKDSENYLNVLEEVKREYQQYVELSKVCELTAQKEKEEPLYLSPSLENPLTPNRFCGWRIVQ